MTRLHDLSDELPAGENLELDIEFGALERAAQGRPETQYGDTINPATPPDWKETETIALQLLERTRDLRVLTHLAVARLHTSGIPGFAEILNQIRDQIETRWQQVHPQLDPEDDNDTTLRANALFRLQDPANVLRFLRDLPLAASIKTGPVTWRDIAVFNGQAEPERGREKPTEALIRAAFRDTDQARLNLLREGIAQAIQEIEAIPAAFEAEAGAGTGPDFTALAKLLGDLRNHLQRFSVVVVDIPEQLPEVTPEMEVPESDAPRPPMQRSSVGVRSISAISTREDALYCLELAVSYFRTHEPSSPVPMLINRAERLATMEFLDILRDLAPDGVPQARLAGGLQPE